MSDKAKTIFISSTFEDLRSCRRRIWELLEKYEVNVRGMEKFGARKDAALTTCLTEVEQCDVFLGVIAYRLGSIDLTSGQSFTQREYEKARELGKNILIYLADEKEYKFTWSDLDRGEAGEKLIAFKSILKERHTVDTFVSDDDLIQKIKRKFDELLAGKVESKPKEDDEYGISKETIQRFLLLPKTYSGKEVKLKVDFIGEPFPAAKVLCSHFNLDYGQTIGIPININIPKIQVSSFQNVFLDGNNISEYYKLGHKNDIEIYTKLQFSEERIIQIKANFVRKEYDVFHLFPEEYQRFNSSLSVFPRGLKTERRVEEAEGTIIAKLTKILINQ
jgi:hypothetical protein